MTFTFHRQSFKNLFFQTVHEIVLRRGHWEHCEDMWEEHVYLCFFPSTPQQPLHTVAVAEGFQEDKSNEKYLYEGNKNGNSGYYNLHVMIWSFQICPSWYCFIYIYIRLNILKWKSPVKWTSPVSAIKKKKKPH